MSESTPDLWKLVKSVFLPVDRDTLSEFMKYFRIKVGETNWSSLFNRLEGVALLILIVGSLLFTGIFIYENQIDPSWVQTLGIQTIIGLVLVAVLLIAKVIIGVIQNINKGESVIANNAKNSILVISLKMGLAGIFVGTPFYVVLETEIGVAQILLFFVLSSMMIGSLIAGFSILFSCILSIKNSVR